MTGFQKYLTQWYSAYGRHVLPWRQTYSPYSVLVSELMLQQTQVDRVIPKYLAFMARFPTIELLAAAPLRDVLILWQGLGYNRRARYLHLCAQTVRDIHKGQFPTTEEEILRLPGVGPYTSRAIAAFAYNTPVVLIETNVRAVFLYHFCEGKERVPDEVLFPYIARELYTENTRLWYSALMDYGAYLKKTVPNPSRTSKHHTRQSSFAGSVRQTRGEIIRLLSQHTHLTVDQLRSQMTSDQSHFATAIEGLMKESLIHNTPKGYTLCS